MQHVAQKPVPNCSQCFVEVGKQLLQPQHLLLDQLLVDVRNVRQGPIVGRALQGLQGLQCHALQRTDRGVGKSKNSFYSAP